MGRPMKTTKTATQTMRRRGAEMAVRGRDLRNTVVRPESLTRRPVPTAAPAEEDLPELDPQHLLSDPRLKGQLAGALFGLLDEPTFTVEEAARIWRVGAETVRRDIRKGALRAYRLPGGVLRILRSDLLAYGRPLE